VLDCLIVLSLVFVSCTPTTMPMTEEKKEETSPQKQEVVTPAPAEFIVSSLSITPSEVKPGEQISISAVVTNTGGSEGSYTAILIINDVEETREDVSIEVCKSQTIDFIVVRNSEGSYKVSIEGKTGQFSVSTPTPIVTPAPTPLVSLIDKKAIMSNPITYQVTRILTITNTQAQVDLVRVWIPSIVAWDSQTNIISIGTTPKPNNIWIDAQYGNSGLYWEFHSEPVAGSSFTVKDEFTYTCYQISYEVDPGKVSMYDKTSSDYQLFTRPEKYIESDDSRIKEIAGQLQQDKTNPYMVRFTIG